MKLPSIQQVARESSLALKRFPFVLADAVVGTLAAVMIVDYEGPPTSSILFKVLFASILGFPLLLASALVAERRGWHKSMALGVLVICVLLLAAYALSVPSNVPSAPQLHVQRLLMLALALCLLVATAPFIATRQLNGFWHYNKILLQRIFLASLFSLTLYSGLALAMASVDQLFGVDIPEKRYGELALLILGMFATWFFLADVPKDLDALDIRTDYPRVLRTFGQYILSPMLIVYFVILYAYVAKIIIEWSWPKGLVSGLIFGFASMGISAYLLLYPIRNKTEYSWIKVAARWFWIVMIPMIVVLQLAIWRRVSEYGVTENRYFAFGLGIWLAAMVVYFLASKTKNIKVIPGSICVLALLTSFGPWGSFRVSERSQVGRLEEILTKNRLFVDGRVRKARGEIPPDDAAQISSIVRYLHDNHGYGGIQPWFSESLRRDSAGLGVIDEEPAVVVNSLGVEYTRFAPFSRRASRALEADLERAVNIEGFDRLLVARLSAEMPESGQPSDGIVCGIDTNLDVMTMRVVQGGMTTDSVQISLRPLVDSLLQHQGSVAEGGIPPDRMSVQTATQTMKLRVILRKIEFRRAGDQLKPLAYDAVALYSLIRQ